ncbi:hypothetical protein QYE76_003174 [Lolium multiflorum]|uniref:Uncharacterized protein n=1 Tax=Lolium multiflorum TaxID=4521 RepID=A0AAD8RPN4_LOLMU|nr:hypothetical protein QYE76_003174 [Lolium multiflorum]
MSGRVPPLTVEAVPSHVATTSLLMGFEIVFGPVGRGKAAMVVLKLWWHTFVDDEFGGAQWSVQCKVGRVGRNLCQAGRHQRGDAHRCHPSFLKGVG